jgi:hypothetical protein
MVDAPKRKAPKLPDGYDDEAAFIKEARERFQRAVDFDRENRDQGIEDLKFYAGEQWDTEAQAARKGRPMLIINSLPSFVAQVVGDIRINRPAIRVRPADDGDKDLAEVREGLIRAIERDSDAQGVYVNAANNQVACGIGNFRIGLKYASNDGFDRDLIIQAIPNAFAVTWDPYSTERTAKDATHCFVSDMVPRKDFETQYDSVLDSGLEVPLHDTDGWYSQDSVRITEYWLIKTTRVDLAMLEGGSVVKASEVPQGVVPIRTRTADVKSACMYLITGTQVLDGPYEYPIDRLPIIRVQGWEVNVGDRRIRGGLVRHARDSQRLKNYWRSVSAEMLALAPKGKWLLEERQEGDQDGFRDAISSDDPVLTYTGPNAPQFIGPPMMNSAVLQESNLNAQDMKDTTGLHDASLGARSNETSGRAIMARQREGDVATYIYPDNLQAAIREGGRVLNMLIPTVFDTARTIRVLGEDDSVKIKRVNDKADPKSLDINSGKYDVSIESGPSYSTKRVEAAESMMQFVQAVPSAAAVSGDLIAKAQDWPMANEIAERLKKTLPPGLATDPDDEKTPEQELAMQQQQQAMQEQQAMQQQDIALSMQLKQAAVIKAQAEAEKAVNEAKAVDQPTEPGTNPMVADIEIATAQAQLRKTNADAIKAEVEAKREEVALRSDIMDLEHKPMIHAAEMSDLESRMNPPVAIVAIDEEVPAFEA